MIDSNAVEVHFKGSGALNDSWVGTEHCMGSLDAQQEAAACLWAALLPCAELNIHRAFQALMVPANLHWHSLQAWQVAKHSLLFVTDVTWHTCKFIARVLFVCILPSGEAPLSLLVWCVEVAHVEHSGTDAILLRWAFRHSGVVPVQPFPVP